MKDTNRPPPQAYVARRHVLLATHDPLVCPNGHKIKHNVALMQHEVFICQHQEPHQKGQCGLRSYVMLMPGGYRYVAEVTPAEMLHMRDERMSVDQVLAYLQGKAA